MVRRHHKALWAVTLCFACGARAEALDPVLNLPDREFGQAPGLSRFANKGRIVSTQAPADLQPLGIRAGAFMILPSLGVGGGHSDNVFASDENTRSDWYLQYEPRVRVVSDWVRHAVQGDARAKVRRYDTFDEEDYEDWQARGEGRLDIGRASELVGEATYRDEEEDRGSPEDAGLDERTRYTVRSGDLAFNHPRGNWVLGLRAGLADFDFEDPDASVPGLLLGDSRDRQNRTGEVRVGYAFRPGYRAFVRVQGNQRRYDRPSASGVNRDSDGFDVGAGLDLALTDLLVGELIVGFQRQTYEADQFDTTQGTSVRANLKWNPTLLTNVYFRANRDVQETVVAGSSGYLRTLASLEIDHELLRTLFLTAGVDAVRRSYGDSSREEELLQMRLGARYLANRHLHLRLTVVRRDQNGSNGGREYTELMIEPGVDLFY